MPQLKPHLMMGPVFLLMVLLAACSGLSTASDYPFVLVQAEAITSPDTAMVIGATRPDTGEPAGEIRWEVLEYRILLHNKSDETLTGLETRIVPSEAIRDLYGGNDPFAESSGLRGHYGKWPEAFNLISGEEVEIIRGIITYAHETDAARNVGSPLTREEADRLLEIADQVTLEVQWDGGSQRFDLAEGEMRISTQTGGSSPTPEESSPPANTVTHSSLTYQAETRVLESAEPQVLDVSVTVTNTSDQPVHIEYGACDISLRVYDNPDRSGGPLAQGGRSGACPLYLSVGDLEPGESISPKEFQLAVPVADILGEALPEGRYYFTAVVEVNGASQPVPAGEADLSHPQEKPSPDEVEITCDPRPRPSQEEIDKELDEIKEPIAREGYLRRLNRGTGEIVPGFGGVFVDRQDNDIAYIYLLDPENEELVAQAAEILRNRPGGRDFREVRAIQGQYSYSQLLEWINCWDARDPQLSRTTASGISEGDNRISIGVASEADIALAERELEALGIPREAANIQAIGGIRFK